MLSCCVSGPVGWQHDQDNFTIHAYIVSFSLTSQQISELNTATNSFVNADSTMHNDLVVTMWK